MPTSSNQHRDKLFEKLEMIVKHVIEEKYFEKTSKLNCLQHRV